MFPAAKASQLNANAAWKRRQIPQESANEPPIGLSLEGTSGTSDHDAVTVGASLHAYGHVSSIHGSHRSD